MFNSTTNEEEEIKTTITHHKNDYHFKNLKVTNDDNEVEKSSLTLPIKV